MKHHVDVQCINRSL